MTTYGWKPKFQNLLRPVSDWLAGIGVTPNMVTIAALVMSVAEGVAIWRFPTATWPLLLLPVVLLARMAMNVIDGMIAKEHNQKTEAGKWLNEVGDIISDLALYAPFLLILPTEWSKYYFAAFLFAAVCGELIGILAHASGGERRYEGPMGKSDRAVAMGALALYFVLFEANDMLMNATAIILLGAAVVTAYRRHSLATAELR